MENDVYMACNCGKKKIYNNGNSNQYSNGTTNGTSLANGTLVYKMLKATLLMVGKLIIIKAMEQ